MNPERKIDRRAFVLGAGVAAAGCATAPSPSSTEAACVPAGSGSTFVLVHGAWLGGWCWGEVADRLRADGHTVYAPSLTGLGDRAHLATEEVSLATHVQDIANLITYEELDDIVLVGHSYSGMVISGVAEAVPEGTIRSIVYLDAFTPKDGESVIDQAPELRELAGDAPFVPVLPGDAWGYPPEMAVRVDRLSAPHPSRTWFEPLTLTGAYERIPRKTFLFATESGGEDAPPLFQSTYDSLREKPDWTVETIDSPHDVMLFFPDEVADLLRRAAV